MSLLPTTDSLFTNKDLTIRNKNSKKNAVKTPIVSTINVVYNL